MIWTILAAFATGSFVLSLVVLLSLTRAASRSDLVMNDLPKDSRSRSADLPTRQTARKTEPRWTVEKGELRIR